MIPVLPFFLALTLGAVLVAGDSPDVRGKRRVRLAYERDWSWVSGDTYPVRGSLKTLGFRWSAQRQAWFIERRIDPEVLAAGLPDDVALFAPGRVLALEGRQALARPAPGPGPRGEIVGLPGSGVPEVSPETIFRTPGIRFGTDAPYRLTSVRVALKVYLGHDEPAILVDGFARDSGSATPLAKTLAYRYADAYGFSLLGHVPTVRLGREKMETDDNPSSASFGRTKRMKQMQWVFQIAPVPTPYTNPETGVGSGEGYKRFPPDEYDTSPAVVRWTRERIWRTLYGRGPHSGDANPPSGSSISMSSVSPASSRTLSAPEVRSLVGDASETGGREAVIALCLSLLGAGVPVYMVVMALLILRYHRELFGEGATLIDHLPEAWQRAIGEAVRDFDITDPRRLWVFLEDAGLIPPSSAADRPGRETPYGRVA